MPIFDHMGAEARLQSAKKVWAKIAEMKKIKDVPVVFMGDLNGLPEEASIVFSRKCDGKCQKEK